MISPIQCDLEATVNLLTNFPGKIDPFPIHYLGIPLGLRRLSKAALQPLVDKVANRLPFWKAGLLNRAGRIVLIKSTLSAIPTLLLLLASLLGPSNVLTISDGRFSGKERNRPKGDIACLLGLEFVVLRNLEA